MRTEAFLLELTLTRKNLFVHKLLAKLACFGIASTFLRYHHQAAHYLLYLLRSFGIAHPLEGLRTAGVSYSVLPLPPVEGRFEASIVERTVKLLRSFPGCFVILQVNTVATAWTVAFLGCRSGN